MCVCVCLLYFFGKLRTDYFGRWSVVQTLFVGDTDYSSVSGIFSFNHRLRGSAALL